MLLLCSVMSAVPVTSKNWFDLLDFLGTTVGSECCIIEHKQAVPHSVCAERSFRAGSIGQDIVSTKIVNKNSDIVNMYL